MIFDLAAIADALLAFFFHLKLWIMKVKPRINISSMKKLVARRPETLLE